MILKPKEKGTLTATAIVKDEQQSVFDIPVDLEWQCEKMKKKIAAVEVEPEGKAAMVIAGEEADSNSMTVTVTARAQGVETPAIQKAVVRVAEDNGARLISSCNFWAEDRGDVNPVNIHKEDFLSWFFEGQTPASNKDGRWTSADPDVNIIQGQNDAFEISATIKNWKEGNKYIFTYEPVNGDSPSSVVVTVGYSLSYISQLEYTPNGKKEFDVGEQLTITAKPNPPLTTDDLLWEIMPTDGQGNHATLKVNDEKGQNATLTMTSPGKFKVRVYSMRERDGELREILSEEITVKSYVQGAAEVYIDGKKFKATSWEAFQKAVKEDESYKINCNKKDDEKRDSPLYYDDIRDEKGNIIGRRLYVALGTDKDFKSSDKREAVEGSKSFAEYNSKKNDNFAEIKLPVELTVNWEDLTDSTTKYPEGTIVKVIRASGTEYYVANSRTEEKRVLSDIAKNQEGWWKLDALLW